MLDRRVHPSRRSPRCLQVQTLAGEAAGDPSDVVQARASGHRNCARILYEVPRPLAIKLIKD